MMSRDFSIGVIGAGMGGLSLARSLQLQGIGNVTVFERNAALSARGGTIRIDSPAQAALEQLGLLAEIERIGIRSKYLEQISNGRLLDQKMYRRDGHHVVSISREALQKTLASAVTEPIRFSQQVVDVTDNEAGAQITFADGSVRRFDLVVGADGVFSTVSKRAFPDTPKAAFTGLVVYYCIARGTFLRDIVHTEHYISRAGLGFRQVTVAGGASDGRWDSLQITTRGAPCSSEWDSEGAVSEMAAYLDVAGPNCVAGGREILASADRVFKWGMYQSPPIGSWVSAGGRVVLLGDAAHAMTPFTGQGASSAIQDGYHLGKLLAEGGLERRTLEHFERVRRPPCEDAIRRAYTRGLHITAHGLSRWYVDSVMQGAAWSGRRGWLAPQSWLERVMAPGARQTEKFDRLIDRFRPESQMRP